MKAIVINQFGNADTFYETELPQPQITPDTVAVAINAFSINPMDIAARAGYLQSPFTDNWTFPLVLGWDFSGTITQVGQNVTKYHISDQVFGTLPSNHAGNAGSYAETAVVDRSLVSNFFATVFTITLIVVFANASDKLLINSGPPSSPPLPGK